jgi:diaminopimelate decarboxylase
MHIIRIAIGFRRERPVTETAGLHVPCLVEPRSRKRAAALDGAEKLRTVGNFSLAARGNEVTMNDPWLRLSVESASSVLQAAIARGLVHEGVQAALFHDLGRVRARIEAIAAGFPRTALHTVAVKANPLVEVLKAVVADGAGLEAASIEEVHLALAAGCPAERLVFDSPAKTVDEIRTALELGVRLNADNFSELTRIARLRKAQSSRSVVGLRVNPEVGEGTIAITNVSGRTSKFGVPLGANEEAILRSFEEHKWLTALHVHVGSQGAGLPMLVAGVARVARLLVDVNRRVDDDQVTTLDVGGGLPVAYRATDCPPTLEAYVAALREAAPTMFEPKVQLVTEFGRAVHATAGFAASRVEYVKEAGGDRLAVIHLGADLLPRTAYQPEHWPHELAVLDSAGRVKQGSAEPWTIVGPLCFGGDVIARGAPLPPIESGDFVLVRDVGAYTLGMWSRHCSRGLPLVLGCDEDELSVLKARETAEQVVQFWSR